MANEHKNIASFSKNIIIKSNQLISISHTNTTATGRPEKQIIQPELTKEYQPLDLSSKFYTPKHTGPKRFSSTWQRTDSLPTIQIFDSDDDIDQEGQGSKTSNYERPQLQPTQENSTSLVQERSFQESHLPGIPERQYIENTALYQVLTDPAVPGPPPRVSLNRPPQRTGAENFVKLNHNYPPSARNLYSQPILKQRQITNVATNDTHFENMSPMHYPLQSAMQLNLFNGVTMPATYRLSTPSSYKTAPLELVNQSQLQGHISMPPAHNPLYLAQKSCGSVDQRPEGQYFSTQQDYMQPIPLTQDMLNKCNLQEGIDSIPHLQNVALEGGFGLVQQPNPTDDSSVRPYEHLQIPARREHVPEKPSSEYVTSSYEACTILKPSFYNVHLQHSQNLSNYQDHPIQSHSNNQRCGKINKTASLSDNSKTLSLRRDSLEISQTINPVQDSGIQAGSQQNHIYTEHNMNLVSSTVDPIPSTPNSGTHIMLSPERSDDKQITEISETIYYWHPYKINKLIVNRATQIEVIDIECCNSNISELPVVQYSPIIADNECQIDDLSMDKQVFQEETLVSEVNRDYEIATSQEVFSNGEVASNCLDGIISETNHANESITAEENVEESATADRNQESNCKLSLYLDIYHLIRDKKSKSLSFKDLYNDIRQILDKSGVYDVLTNSSSPNKASSDVPQTVPKSHIENHPTLDLSANLYNFIRDEESKTRNFSEIFPDIHRILRKYGIFHTMVVEMVSEYSRTSSLPNNVKGSLATHVKNSGNPKTILHKRKLKNVSSQIFHNPVKIEIPKTDFTDLERVLDKMRKSYTLAHSLLGMYSRKLTKKVLKANNGRPTGVSNLVTPDCNKSTSISDEQKVNQPRSTFVLPPEYDPDDSKWTLRFREKKPGLKELLPHTGVYVRSKELKRFLEKSNDRYTLIRLLLTEVFRRSALAVCSLTGTPAKAFKSLDTRPGLDKHARLVLLEFIDRHADKRGWKKDQASVKSISSIRTKLMQMRLRYGRKTVEI